MIITSSNLSKPGLILILSISLVHKLKIVLKILFYMIISIPFLMVLSTASLVCGFFASIVISVIFSIFSIELPLWVSISLGTLFCFVYFITLFIDCYKNPDKYPKRKTSILYPIIAGLLFFYINE